jgi:hypothetical protein
MPWPIPGASTATVCVSIRASRPGRATLSVAGSPYGTLVRRITRYTTRSSSRRIARRSDRWPSAHPSVRPGSRAADACLSRSRGDIVGGVAADLVAIIAWVEDDTIRSRTRSSRQRPSGQRGAVHRVPTGRKNVRSSFTTFFSRHGGKYRTTTCSPSRYVPPTSHSRSTRPGGRIPYGSATSSTSTLPRAARRRGCRLGQPRPMQQRSRGALVLGGRRRSLVRPVDGAGDLPQRLAVGVLLPRRSRRRARRRVLASGEEPGSDPRPPSRP